MTSEHILSFMSSCTSSRVQPYFFSATWDVGSARKKYAGSCELHNCFEIAKASIFDSSTEMPIREEFHLRKIRLNHPDLPSFTTSKWMSPTAYLVYRWFLALYISADVIIDRLFFGRWYSFAFTFWGLISIMFYLDLAAILCTVHYVTLKRETSGRVAIAMEDGTDFGTSDADGDAIQVAPKCLKLYQLVWALYNVCAVNSIIVSVGYWGFLHALFCDVRCVTGIFGFLNVTSHLMNAILMLLDCMIHNIPIQIFHVVYSSIYGIIYYLTTVAVWLASGRTAVFYYFLDYSNRPWLSVGVGLAGLFIVQPGIQLLYYGIYRSRVWLQNKLLAFRDTDGITGEMQQTV